MPTGGQGNQWFCSRCGIGNFRDYNEAHNHEMQCDPFSSRKRRRPASPMGKASNPSLNYKAEQPHSFYPTEIEQTPNQHISSKTPSTEQRFKPCIFLSVSQLPIDKLSPLDVITCQNVEIFKASAGDVADHEGTSGMTVNKGQMGFRCIHCAKNPFAKAEYSSVFPGSLGSVAAGLQLMTKVHFERCTALDPDTRNRIQVARSQFRGDQDDEEWYSEAFVEYSLDVCKRLNIINRSPAQTGIVLAQDKATPSTSNTGSNSIFRYDSGQIDPTMSTTTPSTKNSGNDNQQQMMQQQFQSTGSSQYQASSHMRSDEKVHSSSTNRDSSTPAIGPAPTRSLSPPTLYDSPGSVNFPYFQNQQGFWECRFCWGYPFQQRAQGCFWQSTQPPNRNFMEQHLNLCQHRGCNQNFSAQSQNSMLPQSNQFDNQNHSYSTPKIKQSPYAQQGNPPQMFSSPQSNSRPPIPRPPSNPSQYSTEGMNPQEAYAYQQMQMYNQMQMYQSQGADFNNQNSFNPNYGGFQQGMYAAGQNMEHMMYDSQKTPMAMRSEATLKASIDYLEKEEKEIEARLRTTDEEEEERELVIDDDKSLLTDYFFHIMKQLRFCRFSESDRKTRGGKRDNIKVGFGGLKCVHCSGSQNSRKFFWSNVDRLANSFAEIPSHVLKCRRCPVQTKKALQELKQRHSEQMTRLPRGSQKVFFRRMWRKLHDSQDRLSLDSTGDSPVSSRLKDDKGDKVAEETVASNKESDNQSSAHGNIIVGMSTAGAAKALADYANGSKPLTRILLSIDEDRSWLSDMDCFVRSNLEVFCATQYDIEFAESDRKYPITQGQIGIRCIHCAMSTEGARGTAVSFPPFINGIYESVREFHRVHLESCPHLPPQCKEKLSTLKGSTSLSSVLRRYYVEAAQALGIHDTDEGMRGGGEPKPIGYKEGKEKDLSESIRHIESSNQDYLNMPALGHLTKKRKLGGNG